MTALPLREEFIANADEFSEELCWVIKPTVLEQREFYDMSVCVHS